VATADDDLAGELHRVSGGVAASTRIGQRRQLGDPAVPGS